MRTCYFALVVTALTVLTPACVAAKGGYVRPPPVHVMAAVLPVMPHPLPHISPNEVFGSCGAHRHYDRETQKCRGPADF